MRPVTLDYPPTQAMAWAAEMPDGGTRVIVLNKDPQQELNIDIASRSAARLWRLQAPELTATAGVSLAGAAIVSEHPWEPRNEENLPNPDGRVQVTVSGASAAVIFFDHHLD
jgi:hypothetical protein